MISKKRATPALKATQTAHWTDRFRDASPNKEGLAAHPWLRRVAGRLLEPQLWRMQHEAVARGVAVGMFWAFAIPVGQVAAAALHCVAWRANIPVAAGMTMLTNPFTIGFWLWLAYQVGVLVLGDPVAVAAPQGAGIVAWLAEFGWPTVLGMGIFAVGGAALGYLCVKLAWRWSIIYKRSRRR
jgi:uncharacterized protein